MRSFHELKQTATFTPNSKMLINTWAPGFCCSPWPFGNEYARFDDIILLSKEMLVGGDVIDRSDLDISWPIGAFEREWAERPKFEWSDKDCSQYNNTLFFQGTDHESWKDDAVFNFPEVSASTLHPFLENKYHFRFKYLRKRIHMALTNNKEATRNGILISIRADDDSVYDPKYDFSWYMQHSHFCLVLAGNNPWSIRFYESLQAGCIPVVVSGGWMLPFHQLIDWKSVAIRIPEEFDWENINGLLEIMDMAPGELCARHRAASEIWNNYFKNDAVIFQSFLEALNIRSPS